MRKHKKIVIFLSFLAFFCGWFMVKPTPEVDHMQSFGLFRYNLYYSALYIDHVAIEPRIFAYKYDFPYIYTYGVSGYTKVNIMFLGRVEKVPNMIYDATRPNDLFGNTTTSIKRLKEEFGWRLMLKKSLKDVSKEDQSLYEELKWQGECDKNRFFSYKIGTASDKKIEEGLDELSMYK